MVYSHPPHSVVICQCGKCPFHGCSIFCSRLLVHLQFQHHHGICELINHQFVLEHAHFTQILCIFDWADVAQDAAFEMF